eukprot:CAMPEP_0197200238 /NCGR_PEP_ID=MMETSP1423-20130617/34293_1 /TAXON_ID=476441 /ORGANISM="Pseudo-nitzschia heimii, Strain UNC1101" /LENGTH=284 /DNA_ID=CAMNT_0042654113 /DNA_START=919 /DNA_END=1770 /DNA_ORIENTATION=-
MTNDLVGRPKTEWNYLSGEWKDPFDDYEEESNYDTEEKSNNNFNRCNIFERDPNRCEFGSAVQSFWPDRDILYDNVACSVSNVSRNCTDEAAPSLKETKGNMKIQLEVKIAVCPLSDRGKNGIASNNSTFNNPNDISSGDNKAAKLELVRIFNGIPIMETAESQSCGIVHGVANKDVWRSYGLDIDRHMTITPDTNSFAPSFLLRDSNVIAPYIHNNPKHKQLQVKKCDGIRKRNREAEKNERKKEILPEQDLLPANVRIGLILVVVEIRTALSSLLLGTSCNW